MDGAQLVADELQHPHRPGLRSRHGSEGGRQSGGGVGRKRGGAGRTADRVESGEPIGALSVEEQIATNGGVLSTAGNLVFQGQGTGEFAAYAADTGKKVWSIKTGSAIESIPVTFSVNGEQYVITPVGWGSGSRLFAPARTMATPESKRGPVRLYSFNLGANMPFPYPRAVIPPGPKPPEQKVSQEIIHNGEKLYGTFVCDRCHSPGLDCSGAWE